jgi:hypothetical protein
MRIAWCALVHEEAQVSRIQASQNRRFVVARSLQPARRAKLYQDSFFGGATQH